MSDWNHIRPDDRQFIDEFGDLGTAMELVQNLGEELDGRADIEKSGHRIRARFMTEESVRDIRRGCMTLILFATARFPGPPLDVLPAAIRRLQSVEDVPDGVLPMLAGGLTAALLGTPADEWRDRLGPVPREESLAWVFAAWSILHFLDLRNQERGYAMRSLEATIARILDEDALETKD